MTARGDGDSEASVDGVGLVGAGSVGQWFVTKLVRAGHEPTVYDVDPEAVATAVETGAVAAESPADVAETAEVVVLSLPGREFVETVMEADDGVLETLGPGKVVVDTGTTPPDVDVYYQRVCHDRDAGYVDCGMTWGGPGEFDEERGPAYTMFAGGAREDYERARPVIEVLSHTHEFYEGVGNGHVVKAANRMRQNCRAAVDAEMVEFLADNGVDPRRVVEMLEWDVREAVLDYEYPSTEGFERAVETDEGDTEARGVEVDDRGARPRLRTSDWAKDPAYALAIAHASNTHMPILTAVYQTQLVAENYGAALLDRDIQYGDPEWHDRSDVLSVYRALNRPREEWRRLGRWSDEDGGDA